MKMKNAIAKYINSKMNLEDEVQFINDMLALKFTWRAGVDRPNAEASHTRREQP